MENFKKAYMAITHSPTGKYYFYLELDDEIFYAWNFTPDASSIIESQLNIVAEALLKGVAFRAPDYYDGSALDCYLHYTTLDWYYERDVTLNLPWRENKEVSSNA